MKGEKKHLHCKPPLFNENMFWSEAYFPPVAQNKPDLCQTVFVHHFVRFVFTLFVMQNRRGLTHQGSVVSGTPYWNCLNVLTLIISSFEVSHHRSSTTWSCRYLKCLSSKHFNYEFQWRNAFPKCSTFWENGFIMSFVALEGALSSVRK